MSTQEFFGKHVARLQGSKRASARKIAAAMETAMGLPAFAKDALDTAAKDPQWQFLNDAGKKAKRSSAMEKPFATLARLRLEAGQLRRAVADGMPKLPTLAKDDLTGFLSDQEARAYVRSLPQEQRNRLERLPAAVVTAVVRAAPELSGVSPSMHQMLRDQLAEASNPAEVTGLREDREALDWLDEAIRQAEKPLVEAAGFAHDHERRQFEKRVAEPIIGEFEAKDEQRRETQDAETMEQLFERYTKAPHDARSMLIDRMLAVQVEDVRNR